MISHTPARRRATQKQKPLSKDSGTHTLTDAFRSPARVTILCLLVLVALNLFLYRDHWRGRTFFPFDFPLTYYASTAYWMASVQAGEWPHWIPYQGMGYPSVLNPQLGIFYPPFWIFVLLRIPYTLHAAVIFQVLHVLFGSIGFFFLARRLFANNAVALFGASAFALFGGFFTNAEHPDIIRGFSWTPWIFLCLLLRQEVTTVRVMQRRILTRLSGSFLPLPVVIAWFICGAYPGHIVSVLVITGLFVVAQNALHLRGGMAAVAVRDAVVQFTGIALGLIMAAVLLLPAASVRTELVRAHTWDSIARHYVQVSHVWHLIFPSNLIAQPSDEYSMMGMQVPIVMLLFVPFAWRYKRRLLPFLVCAIGAAVMSLSVARPVSTVLISIVPALGVSRFPNGDYRIFLYFGVLLLAVGGFCGALERPVSTFWRGAAFMLAILCAIEFAALRLEMRIAPPDKAPFLHVMYVATVCGVVSIAAYGGVLKSRRWRPLYLSILVAALIVSGYATVDAMKPSWSEPRAEIAYYTSGGLQIMQNGRLTASQIFTRFDTTRPPRVDTPTPFHYAWRGYINGTYMMSDYGPKSLSQETITANAGLSAVMRRGTEVFVLPCGSVACDSSAIDSVPLGDNPAAGAKSVVYRRNSIVYQIPVNTRSLVVENEIFSPGWSGVCETHGEKLTERRVDGALRGWVLNPGMHRIRVEYRTPLLNEAAAVSAAGYTFWCVLAAWVLVHRRRAVACDDHI